MFQSVAARHDVRQAWLGLAAARLRLTGAQDAAEPLAIALSRHAFAPDIAAVANAIGLSTGAGWCAVRSDGRLEIQVRIQGKIRIHLDGKPIRGTTLPAGWERGRTIDVQIGETPLLGSPVDVTAIRRVAGCVEATEDGIRGWAWYPGDPETPPALTLRRPDQTLHSTIIPQDESATVSDIGPLARPRWFHLTRPELPATPGLVHIQGPDGHDLPGSPLDPFANEAAAARQLGYEYPAFQVRPKARPSGTRAAGAQSKAWDYPAAILRADGPMPSEPVGADTRKRPAAIIIPVHNGGEVVLACFASVLGSRPPRTRIIVVDDGSTEPGVVKLLDDLVRRRTITLLRHGRALGFPASVNAGMRAIGGHDVVLLNSDTLVPPGWVERLRAAAYAGRDIGTVTPFSNDASILSYPGPAGFNPNPDQAAVNRLDRLVQRAAKQPSGVDPTFHHGGIVDIPVGVGFCLYLRRDCLDAVGSFRPELFAQGYGEENDFCLRARRLGWRSVALTGLFVGHVGGASFGGSAAHLRARNSRIIE